MIRQITFWTSEMFLRRDGKLIRIEKPGDATAVAHRDLLLIRPRSDWKLGDRTYPGGVLLATDFERFLKGGRSFDVLFEPTDRKSLAGFSPTLNQILINELDNVHNRLYRLTRREGRWHREPLPGTPCVGSVNVFAVDDDESDDYFQYASDYLTPSTLSLGVHGKGDPAALKQSPAFFEARGLQVKQHEAISQDGTRVPYFRSCA